MESNVRFAIKRLEDLKQGTIINNLENMNLDSNYELYDSLIKSFQNGDLDSIYNSFAFRDLNDDEKAKLMEIARKYLYLCFGQGGVSNWVEYATVNCSDDFSLCFMNIFANFDILLEVLRYGGENSLKMISAFNSDENLYNGSIIDELRVYFPDVTTLKQAMIEMGLGSNKFSQYSDSYKKLLCQFADGVLYKKEGDDISFRSPRSIGVDVRRMITGEDDPDTFDFDEYEKMIQDSDVFISALMNLSLENGSDKEFSEESYAY